MTYPRIACLVPGCRRGTTRFAEGEFICAVHWPATDWRLRKLMFKARRLRRWSLAAVCWRKLRRQAIERAFGI